MRDQEQRERELAEERRQCEEESQRQLDTLRSLMKEIHDQGEAAMQRADKVKVSKLTEEDDIKSYLTTFERLMQAYEIPKVRWAYKLAPQLVGKAQQAYAAMGISEAGNYDELKAAVLRRYDIHITPCIHITTRAIDNVSERHEEGW